MRRGPWLLVIAALLSVVLAWLGPREGDARATNNRTVSLSPAITETLFYIGAADRLSGRSDWCTLPSTASSLPGYGSGLTPNLEQLMLSDVGRVLVDVPPPEELKQLLHVEEMPWLTVSDLQASTRELGRLFGRTTEAEALAGAYDVLHPKPQSKAAHRVLVLLGIPTHAGGDIWYIKPNTLHGAVVAAAGLNNIMPASDGPPSVSVERAMQLVPDRIVVLSADADLDTPAALAALRASLPLDAVMQGKVDILTGPETMSVGPSLLSTLARLRALRP
ncbi:MAG: ABC transporter substrate-binding protein [Myxococcota bacterium]